ncbi:Mitotic spindle assembly checkpoint protein MAD2A [Bos mutus]|uniref:Mitotic spindle assembly checkpoint protein MAD2A n=1 Tax=Bos mutus TaxID=72004 RepID=L8I8M8_9CETA|nr:PREDICTED: mitotic spindle assembly checkpoint protein MAD2A [Bos mutus]ELR52568.1 Mitotic spindle assembly checkpoint protein MAD2A [Bos mutus]
MALQLSREQGITLRGSAEIVAEFFSFGINSILYQRGLYPSETFTRVQKYGLTLLVTTDPELILSFLILWVVQNVRETRTVLLLWKKIMYFNDFISNLGSFDLLICTDKDLVVPEKWEESGPQFITNSEEVRLRSFTTTIHKVNSMVAYTIPVND